jgi:hypothetical protein
MLWAVFHRLVVALTLLAFVGGMTLQVLPPKAAFAAGTMAVPGDCSHVAMPPADPGPAHKVPCKGMDPECIKQMGCLGTPSLPLRLGAAFVPIAYTIVAYWTRALSKDGRSIKPDVFPPIGL